MEVNSWLLRCDATFREGRTATPLQSPIWEARAQAAFACLLKEVTKQRVCQGNVDSWQNINGITFPSTPDLGFKADEPVSSPGRLQDNHNRKENNNDKVKRTPPKF